MTHGIFRVTLHWSRDGMSLAFLVDGGSHILLLVHENCKSLFITWVGVHAQFSLPLLLLFVPKMFSALSCWASRTQASQRIPLQLVIREQAKLLIRAQQEQEPREQQEAQREQQEAQGVIITNTTMTLSPVPEQPLASESMWQDNQS